MVTMIGIDWQNYLSGISEVIDPTKPNSAEEMFKSVERKLRGMSNCAGLQPATIIFIQASYRIMVKFAKRCKPTGWCKLQGRA